jgi:ketol-acid reductoisomerase
MKLAIDPRSFPLLLTDARIAVLGYGPCAAHHALGLRDAGNHVAVGMRSGGRSWARALRDGFQPAAACSVIAGASVVAVLVPDEEQAQVYWHAIEPSVAPGALLVFGRALALGTRAFEPRGVDVVVVAAHDHGCRVAVHGDATGRALERAIAYAHAAFGPGVTIATTTTAAEVDAELAALEAAAGSAAALRTAVEAAAARARDSHAPDEAHISYCEGLRELVEDRAGRGGGVREPVEHRARPDGARGEVSRGSALSLVAGVAGVAGVADVASIAGAAGRPTRGKP